MSSQLTPTEEQLAILEAFKHSRVLKINAIAGSGKTTTLELLAEAHKEPILLLAFNKAIADEASRRFPPHVVCRTMNSLAYADFGKPLAHKLNANKNPKLNTLRSLRNVVDWLSLDDYPSEPVISSRTIASLARDACDNFCYSARQTISDKDIIRKDIKELQKEHQFDEKHLSRAIVDIARLIWKERTNVYSTAMTTHDTYVKLWQLSQPRINYDTIFVDEAQDVNPCVLDVLQCQSCRVVYVGDQHQSIYAFRGATNAMKTIEASTMSLSQSWRYGEVIANVAEAILIKHDVVIHGNPSINSEIAVIPSDSVHTEIFRTNSGLLMRAEELISEGISVSIEINVKDFIMQVKSIKDLMKGLKPFHDNIARFTSFTDLMECSKEDVEIKRMMHTAIRSDCLEFLDKLENNKLDKNPTVILTTAHKSKGLEFDNVKIADDFKFSESQDLLKIPEQEINLLYVAVTRAKEKMMLPFVLFNYLKNEGVLNG